MIRKILLPLSLLVASVVLALSTLAVAGESSQMKVVTLDVENMTCAMCPYTVKKSLTKVSGVEKAEVDYDSKTARVTFDPSKTDIAALTEATTNVGYPSRLKQ